MSKYIGVILLILIIAAGVVWQRQQPTAADPLAVEKIALKQAELNRLTEKEKQRTEEERRETARTLATIERQRRVESSKAVSAAAVALALTWRLTFPILLFSGLIGAGVYVWRKPVLFEFEGVRAWLPRHTVPEVTQQALVTKQQAEMVKALAYAEGVTQERVKQIVETVKALKPGRENVVVNQSSLPAATEQPQQAGNVAFQQAVRDFKQDHILIGYDSDGQPVFFPLNGFVSCAFGGGSGSGKTSKLRFLTAQLILNGVNVSILDAHKGNEQSLVDSLGNLANMPNVRIFNPFETHQAVDVMLSDVQHAIDSGKPADAPNVFILDELRPLNKACSDTELLMDKLSNEGRKFGFFGVFASQTWEAKMFKQSGSAARDACVLKMAARMPKEQARTLFKDGGCARTVARLSQAEMFADSAQFSGVVTVPFCSRQDLDRLGAGASQAGAGTTQAVKPSVGTGADVDAPEANVGADVIDFAARREQRGNATPTVSLAKQPDTGAFPPLPQDALAAQLREYLQARNMSLSKFADGAGVNKGLLSVFLRGDKRLSEAMTDKVTAAMRGETREVTAS